MKRLLVCAASFALLGACFDFEGTFSDCYEQGRCVETTAAAPVVVATTPLNRLTDVDPATIIRLTFDKPMVPTSVTATLTPAVNLVAPQWSADGATVTFTPQSNLAYSTQYSLRFEGKATDGGKMEATDVLTFTVRAVPQGPTLVSSSPVSGANEVPLGAGLALTFSAAVDATSFVATTNPAIFLGNPAWTTDELTVTFPSATPYLPNTSYTVTFAGKGKDGLNIVTPSAPVSFATVADVVPPTVQSTNPVGGAADASVTIIPSVTFSEEMNGASVLGAASISPDAGCQWSLNASNEILSCAHAAPFADATTYTVAISATATDAMGNALQSPFSFSFTTGLAPDVTPPSVQSTTPASGAAGVDPATAVTVTFSEPMDPATTQAALTIGAPSGTTATNLTWTTPNVLRFNLTPVPPENTNVTWTIGTGATDASGNALTAAFTRTFKTWRTVTTTITTDATLDATVYKTSTLTGVTQGTTNVVGNSSSPSASRAYFSFDLTSIYVNAPIAFISARLDTVQEGFAQTYSNIAGGPDINFNPFYTAGQMYGPVIAENIKYGSTVEGSDFNVAAIAAGGLTTIALSNQEVSSPNGTVHAGNVLSWFVPQFAQWNGSATSADRYVQFRVRCTNEPMSTYGNPAYGRVFLRAGESTTLPTTTLTVTYYAP